MVVDDGSPKSPEAKLGLEVEDLWDIQEPQLSPTEKLNACFESIPVSEFPQASSSQGRSLSFWSRSIGRDYVDRDFSNQEPFITIADHFFDQMLSDPFN